MKKRKLKIPTRAIIIILLLFIVIYLFFSSLSHFLWTSEYFNIRTVTTNDKNIDLSYLKGKNIFNLNLNQESQKILAIYPNYNKIRLIRQLPSCIRVDLQKREALAYVRLYRYFAVDEDAVLFDLDNNNVLNPNLPVILGLETKIFGPKAGNRYHSVKELTLCLHLIKEMAAIRGLKDCRIKKIDASNPVNLSFYILENIEVKIGQNNINHKLRLLNSILAHQRLDLGRIKYIDLRFKEPVIKYKYEK